ncbi:MAG: hypothetical protein N2253_04425 [Bacteroidia bacterium]|nr:hypothetical protein [Bacteroidia bacterium]MCX7764125.1 hypothetical protein [Bacteroidia bacterium]MDW8057552.1 hypothetical protein [Bacteroidia bacterium]
MRFFLYGLATTAALVLWFLVKLDRTYLLTHTVQVYGGEGKSGAFSVNVEIEGDGYSLLRWKRIDTISAARLCLAPPTAVEKVKLRWDLSPLRRAGICGELRLRKYRPSLHWVLPSGADFVGPYEWISDSIWSLQETLPSWEYQLVAKPGRHRYPIPLPAHWGVYPETLWVQAEVSRYIYAATEVTPQSEGTEGYTLILQPPRVQVRFWVPQAYADQWKPSDFLVVVDMRKVMPTDSVVFPELRKRPPYVRNVEIYPSVLGFTRLY